MTEDFKNAYYTGQKLIAQFEGSIKTQLITNSFPCNPPLIENPQTPVFGGIENSPYPNDSNLPDFNPSIVVSNPFYNSPGFWFNLGQNGNGSGSGGGGGGGSEVPSCGWVIYVVKCNGGGGHDGSEPRCTGTFKGATYAVDTCTGFFVQIYKNSNTKKGENSEESEGNSDPCPPVDGIGILEPSSAFMNFVFNLPVNLKNWLTKPYPQGASQEIKDLIENYVNSANADLAFAEELAIICFQNQNVDHNLVFNVLLEKQNDSTLNLNELFTLAIINNINNAINNDPIEFYLLMVYKNSPLLNISAFSSASNSLTVGNYTLTPHYKANGTLVFYSAVRFSNTTGNAMNGIEYIIKPTGLSNFQEKIELYTAAANLFYLNGTPSQGQIAMAAGDYITGLKDMWADALTNPQYYIYLAHIFVASATNLNAVNSNSTTFEGKIKFTSSTTGSSIQNITINNRSAVQYKQLISNKFPNANWVTHSSPNVD